MSNKEHLIMVQYLTWITPTRGACQISQVYLVFFCVAENRLSPIKYLRRSPVLLSNNNEATPLFDYGFIATVDVNIVHWFLSLQSHTALFSVCLSLIALYDNELWWSRRRKRTAQKVGNFYRFSLLLYLGVPVDEAFLLLFHNTSVSQALLQSCYTTTFC